MTSGTAAEAERRHGLFDSVRVIGGDECFSIGAIEVTPFHVSHDAEEPVQFTFSDGASRVGLLTDTGEISPYIRRQLDGCDALMLECNYDPDMLDAGPYPYSLKKRVRGRFGHLSNQQAAALLGEIDVSALQHIAVMHLSEQNNCKERALSAVSDALGCEKKWVSMANQQDGLGWRDVA